MVLGATECKRLFGYVFVFPALRREHMILGCFPKLVDHPVMSGVPLYLHLKRHPLRSRERAFWGSRCIWIETVGLEGIFRANQHWLAKKFFTKEMFWMAQRVFDGSNPRIIFFQPKVWHEGLVSWRVLGHIGGCHMDSWIFLACWMNEIYICVLINFYFHRTG